MANDLSLRQLKGDDEVDALVEHFCRHAAESGKAGAPIFAPVSASQVPDRDSMRARRRVGWRLPLTAPRWERAWGYFSRAGELVGHLELHGGGLRSELHRAQLGMGLEFSHRAKGIGSRLMDSALRWATAQSSLAWIELGVFADNAPARRLYDSVGFVEIGRIDDRFRVDGVIINDIRMVLELAKRR